jgi:DNA helicase-2/ATP-dependent DNA helicase PcrA
LRFIQTALSEYEATFVPQRDFIAWEGKSLSHEEIHRWFYEEFRHYPLIPRKERVFARIKRWLEMEYKEIRALDPRGTVRRQAYARLRAYMKAWPTETSLQLYRKWLAFPLAEAVGGTDHRRNLRGNPKEEEVGEEDLAPLLYIHNQLHDIDSSAIYDHIVIDEAQDLSPFQFAVLKRHCRGHSFTILGDLLQNVFSFQGIRDWQEFRDLFAEGEVAYFQLNKSYRSTMEIIRFANAIVKKHVE